MNDNPRKNDVAMKCLAGLLVGLLLAAVAGGFALAQEVAGMSAKIEALTRTVQDMNARVLYLERAIRLANKARDD